MRCTLRCVTVHPISARTSLKDGLELLHLANVMEGEVAHSEHLPERDACRAGSESDAVELSFDARRGTDLPSIHTSDATLISRPPDPIVSGADERHGTCTSLDGSCDRQVRRMIRAPRDRCGRAQQPTPARACNSLRTSMGRERPKSASTSVRLSSQDPSVGDSVSKKLRAAMSFYFAFAKRKHRRAYPTRTDRFRARPLTWT